jgi:predicted dehydrogenase
MGVPWFADYCEMLKQMRPAGAIVATPNELHTPVGVACAELGIHILMENPLAHSLEAGQQIVAAVRSAGVSMTVGHHRRFDPAVAMAKRILADEEIGKLIAVSAVWALRKHDGYFDHQWRRDPGGGPVLINQIHDIDLLRHFCGEIDRVFALALQKKSAMPPSKDYEGYATRVL